MTDIKAEVITALSEYFFSCSVVITSDTPGFDHGTGVAVRFNNEDYILAAAHVLEKEPSNEKLLITSRPESILTKTSKNELREQFFAKRLGKIKPSTGTHISISNRLAEKALGDIAALKLENAGTDLPSTVFHDLSKQDQASIAEGNHVTIVGYPGALHIQHKINNEPRVALFPYCTGQTIMTFPKWTDPLNPFYPSVDFFTDFTHDETTCDPGGMSGGGAWALPDACADKLWAPQQSRLLGIQSGLYREKKLLRLVRIERVLELLSNKH
jgi:hypothetical protein